MTERIVISSPQRGTIYEGEGDLDDWQSFLPEDQRDLQSYVVTQIILIDDTPPSVHVERRYIIRGDEGYILSNREGILLSQQEASQLQQLLNSKQGA